MGNRDSGAQLRDQCGAPPPLVTYHAGGTLAESRYIPVFAPGQLSESHGTWSHDGGLTYTGRVVTMIHFDTAPGTPPGSPGFQAGWMIATQTITLKGMFPLHAIPAEVFADLRGRVWSRVRSPSARSGPLLPVAW